jgi:predicted permease
MSDERPSRGFKRAFRLGLTRRSTIDAETDEELRFHLEQRINDLMARGRTRQEAEAEALARFGPYPESRAQLLEAARSREETLKMADRFDALRYDVIYALRQLRRAPVFTAGVVATFALGIGANATMFGVIDQLLLRGPKYVREPDRIVSFAAGAEGRGFGQKNFNYPAYKAIRDHATGFASVAATDEITVPMGNGENARNLKGLLATASYFPMLGVTPQLGRFFLPEEDVEPTGAPVVVISDAFWASQFGRGRSALGARLHLGDREYSVVGVAPPGFTGLDLTAPDVWLPMTSAGSMQPMGRHWATNSGGTWLSIHARLAPGIPAAATAASVMRVVREAAPNAFFTGKNWRFSVRPFLSTRAADQGADATVTTLLAAMSVVVLLIACANVANLLLARGLRRRREIAVRLAIGVSRSRLIGQLLTESLLLALLGAVAALFVAYWSGGLLRQLLLGDIASNLSPVDPRVLAATAVVALGTGLLTGLLPALQTTRPELAATLKTGDREGGGRHSRTRSMLLAGQAAMCFLLLIGAGLFVRSLDKLGSMRMGVDVDRVLIGSMNLHAVGRPNSEADAIYARALEAVQNAPEVRNAAVAATVPFGASFGTSVVIPGEDSLRHVFAMYNAVTPDYFRTLGSQLLAGRQFGASDAAGAAPVAIVSEELAQRYSRTESPVGRCVRINADTAPCTTIVGVVENVRRQSIFDDSIPFIYFPLAQLRTAISDRQLIARVGNGDAERLAEPIRRAMQRAAPGLPFADVRLVASEPIVRQEMRPFRLGASLFGAFGLLALVLAAIGVYGVVSYDFDQRRREVGVRRALGAQSLSVGTMVLRHGLTVIGAGLAAGAIIAYALGRFIAPLLYQMSPRDPTVFSSVGVILVGVATLACLVPAWRATRVDPAIVLRSE